MKISQLNEKITIQKKTIQSDRIGNRIEKWTDYFKIHCRVDSRVLREEEGTAYTIDDSKLVFMIRWSKIFKELDSTHYRIVFKGQFFNILGVDNMNYKNESIKIHCQKVER